MKAGQRVTIKAEGHQQNGQSGKLMAFKCVPELGMAWRIRLDSKFECYARPEDVVRS